MNEPFPGLSITSSVGNGFNSSMIFQPLSPRVNIRPSGPSVPISAPAPVYYDESDTTRCRSVYYWKIQSQIKHVKAEFRSRLNNNNNNNNNNNKKERVF